MTHSYVDLYKHASDSLIDAMREVIQLIGLDGEIFEINMKITNLMRDSIINHRIESAAVLYNGKVELTYKRLESVRDINTSLVSSIKYLLEMLKVAFEDPSLVQEIALCQKLLDDIMNFINKEYIINDVNLAEISQNLLLFISKYSDKRFLPQFNLILDQIFKLYNLSFKDHSNITNL